MRVDESTSVESLRRAVKQWRRAVGLNERQDCVGNGFRVCRTSGRVLVRKPDGTGYVSKAKKIWEEANGEIPKGFVVVCKDGDRLDCRLENLELIAWRDLMLRKPYKDFPEELKPAVDALIELKKTIESKQKEKPRRQPGEGVMSGRFWSGADKRFVKENYPSLSYKTIGERLGRSKESVRHTVKKLGLKKPPGRRRGEGEINA